MSRIKVGFIGPCIGVGGADAFMLSMIKYSQRLEFTGITTYHPSKPKQVDFARNYTDIPIYEYEHNQPRVDSMKYLPNLAETAKAACEDADIIIAWCQPNLKECLSSLNKPVVELAQNSDELATSICTSNDEFVDYRVAVSKTAMRAFPKHRQQNVRVIYNGIDPCRVAPRFGRATMREMLKIGKEEKLITFMGRFVKEKNPESLIQALIKLPPEYRGLYVGAGALKDDLFKEAQRHLEPGRVIFMDSEFYVGDILTASDCFTLVSDFEGMPLAVLEAWLAGVPTVVSNIDPMKELVQDFNQDFAVYVEPRASTAQLVQAIGLATSDSEELMQRMNAARQLVWEHFNISRVTLLWEEFLNDSLHHWRGKQNRPFGYLTTPPKVMKAVNDG